MMNEQRVQTEALASTLQTESAAEQMADIVDAAVVAVKDGVEDISTQQFHARAHTAWCDPRVTTTGQDTHGVAGCTRGE